MRIDLNIDAAESPADLELFSVATSVNLACGFHAGDTTLMLRAAIRAAELGILIGAHPGYADRAGFGRIEHGHTPARIEADTLQQLRTLDAIIRRVGAVITHVKPHGALYNRVAVDPEAARAVARAAAAFRPGLKLYALGGPGFGSIVEAVGDLEVTPVPEAFPDRAYMSNGTLAPRQLQGALITSPAAAAAQAVAFATGGSISTLDGGSLSIEAATLCVHGDGPAALETARAIRRSLDRLVQDA